jgi:hypothetical protein
VAATDGAATEVAATVDHCTLYIPIFAKKCKNIGDIYLLTQKSTILA